MSKDIELTIKMTESGMTFESKLEKDEVMRVLHTAFVIMSAENMGFLDDNPMVSVRESREKEKH